MCAPVGLDPTKTGPPNEISSKKATIGPNKSFQPIGKVMGSTLLQTGQVHFMMHTICHNWHATSDSV
jgi:hypothetical protein